MLSTLSKRYRIGSLFALRLSEKRINCIYVLLDFCSADCAFLKNKESTIECALALKAHCAFNSEQARRSELLSRAQCSAQAGRRANVAIIVGVNILKY